MNATDRTPLTRVAPATPLDLETRVAELEQLVAAMTAEVRTRRLVVVDEHGEERIFAEARKLADGDDVAELTIQDGRAQVVVAAHRKQGAALWVRGDTSGEIMLQSDLGDSSQTVRVSHGAAHANLWASEAGWGPSVPEEVNYCASMAVGVGDEGAIVGVAPTGGGPLTSSLRLSEYSDEAPVLANGRHKLITFDSEVTS